MSDLSRRDRAGGLRLRNHRHLDAYPRRLLMSSLKKTVLTDSAPWHAGLLLDSVCED